MEANGVKPHFSMEMYSLYWYKEMLWDAGVTKWFPSWTCMVMGKHANDTIYTEPGCYLQVINNIDMIKNCIPDPFIGIEACGRYWLPVAVMGLLHGAELVRTGIEDQFFLWPHRDDISTKASTTTELIVNIATSLGREIATPQDVRDRLGMTLTSR